MEWNLYDITYSKIILPQPKERLDNLKREIPDIPLFSSASRYVNPGEHLTVNHKVISRAYFKMWEILHRYMHPKEKTKALFLCEAPGGFQQAASEFFERLDWHALTLPGSIAWEGDPSKILYRDIIKDTIPVDYKVSLVTGDGGFESNPEKQEEENYPLFEAQMLKGYECLLPEGYLVVKFFDMFQPNTQGLIIEMARRFETCYILKPWGSRICNSERYFIGLRKLLVYRPIIPAERLHTIANDYAQVQIAALQAAFQLARIPGITRDLLEKPNEKQEAISKNIYNSILHAPCR